MKTKKPYSERFIVSDSGDRSVGIDGWSFDVDLIIENEFDDPETRKEFTDAFKEFLLDWFTDIQTEVHTLGEIQGMYEQYDREADFEKDNGWFMPPKKRGEK